jgi:CBS domain-containing protein
MKISQVMTRGVECTKPNATLQDAARRMRDLDVGVLPVCGDEDRLVGMVTDRDIIVRAAAEGQDPGSARVKDVMTPEVIYAFEDQDVSEAARLMKEHQVRRLIALNRDRRLVGILSLGDLAVDGGDARLSGTTLEAVSEPSRPREGRTG